MLDTTRWFTIFVGTASNAEKDKRAHPCCSSETWPQLPFEPLEKPSMFTQCVVISKLCVSNTCTRARLRRLRFFFSGNLLRLRHAVYALKQRSRRLNSNCRTHSPNTTAEQPNSHKFGRVATARLHFAFRLRCPFPPSSASSASIFRRLG